MFDILTSLRDELLDLGVNAYVHEIDGMVRHRRYIIVKAFDRVKYVVYASGDKLIAYRYTIHEIEGREVVSKVNHDIIDLRDPNRLQKFVEKVTSSSH